ncbi:solute carrier family 23 protein [Microbulbifer rhizosphaerae]|uniref:NCS2 family nucleobase:cation symporter-2/xanthine permease XanP n=1 Tax=Microbulbifer rhizosphaerae TaxID=1562603 RepID=A0A7W4ZAI3_9GAMM|nr:NCS2 family nucleobase:cation symporter-2/xanthine permease XanP [Microbulbifer rhizosphaerae]
MEKFASAFDYRPPPPVSLLIALQHLLAVFGAVITPPLILAHSMALPLAETSYLVSASLLISGVATLIQIHRIGPLGSGLLSIQGTSFTFIGPLLAVYFPLLENYTPSQALGVLMGSCAVCALIVGVCAQFVHRLRGVITANVTGTAVILIGASLVYTTLNNLLREFADLQKAGDSPWLVPLLAAVVLGITLFLARRRNRYLRIVSVTAGLVVGFVISLLFGLVDFSGLRELEPFFLPQPNHFPLAVDAAVVAVLLPVFFISSVETLGDLTATSRLSGFEVGSPGYWRRLRGGLSGDAFNSFLAAVFGSFPNTSFSQNNGVIRLTGVCSPYVGRYVAALLCLLGMFPLIGGLFIAIPAAVVYGATLLMFFMVLLSGIGIVNAGDAAVKSWPVVIAAIAVGVAVSLAAKHLTIFPRQLAALLQFPISTGAVAAVLIELSRKLISAPALKAEA